MALNNLRDFIKAIDTHRRAGAGHSPGACPAGDRRDRRPVHEEPGRRAGAPVRARRCWRTASASPHAGGHQPVRLDAADVPGARRRDSWTTSAAASPRCSNLKVPEGLFGKLAHAAASWPRSASFRRGSRAAGRPARRSCCAATTSTWTRFPFLTTWPEDGGRYITLPMVITTRSRAGASATSGMYRVQVIGRDTLAMHWQRHKVGAAHWREMAARGERMPVVIALGGDPREHLLRLGAAAAHDRRVSLRRFPPAGAGGAGQGGDLRPRRAGRGGDRDRGLHRSRRGAGAGRAVRRPHRLLLAGRLLSQGARHRGHDAAGSDLSRHAGRAGRRWRTSTSATPPSGSSCRCSSSRFPRSWTTTCRRRGSFTTWCSSRSTSSIPDRPTR